MENQKINLDQGGLLLEVLLVFSIFILTFPLFRKYTVDNFKEAKNFSVAKEMDQIRQVLELYLSNYEDEFGATGNSPIVQDDLSFFHKYGLPSTFPEQSIYGQDYKVKYKKVGSETGPLRIEGMVIADGGEMDGKSPTQIASEIGYFGGYKTTLNVNDTKGYWIEGGNQTVILSSSGSWVEQPSDWGIGESAPNVIVAKTNVINLKTDFILREESTDPKDHTMKASLEMAGNNIEKVGTVATEKLSTIDFESNSEFRGFKIMLVRGEAEINHLTGQELIVYGDAEIKDSTVNGDIRFRNSFVADGDVETNMVDTYFLDVDSITNNRVVPTSNLTGTIESKDRIKADDLSVNEEVNINNLEVQGLKSNNFISKISAKSGSPYYLDLNPDNDSNLYDVIDNKVNSRFNVIGDITIDFNTTLDTILQEMEDELDSID